MLLQVHKPVLVRACDPTAPAIYARVSACFHRDGLFVRLIEVKHPTNYLYVQFLDLSSAPDRLVVPI